MKYRKQIYLFKRISDDGFISFRGLFSPEVRRESFCRLTSTDIYRGANLKNLDTSPKRKAGFQKGVRQRKPDATPTIAVLPTEFMELVRTARASKTHSFIKVERTAKKSAVGVSTIWRDVKLGVFVPPVRISSRSVAWVEAEVDAVLAAKALMHRTDAKIDLAQFVAALINQAD